MALPESAVEFIAGLVERARGHRRKQRIVFPEGADARVRVAAERLARDGVLHPILVGRAPSPPPPCVTFVDPETAPHLEKYAQVYRERRRSKGITHVEAMAVARRPLFFADLMVAAGDADGMVGGAGHTTAETVRAALQSIGTDPKARLVSSFFIMCVHDRSFGHEGRMLFADCAVNVEPQAVQLAEIALVTAASARALLGVEPSVALLSFSTKGSARHAQVERVQEALRIIKARAPELNVDGELQADAALIPAVGRSKAPGSTVAGQANVLVFPNLAAGNIGYKLIERVCSSVAIGPFLQGLNKPANDLSRGVSADTVYRVAVVTAIQAEAAR